MVPDSSGPLDRHKQITIVRARFLEIWSQNRGTRTASGPRRVPGHRIFSSRKQQLLLFTLYICLLCSPFFLPLFSFPSFAPISITLAPSFFVLSHLLYLSMFTFPLTRSLFRCGRRVRRINAEAPFSLL